MSFSLIGTHVPVELEHPEVVGKTCPTFFELWRLPARRSLPADGRRDRRSGGGREVHRGACARGWLGFTYLDSGAMYRASRSLRSAACRSRRDRRRAADRARRRVLLDGDDVTELIRSPEVSAAASSVAAEPAVRAAMVDEQRRLLARGDWVAEGRDIGTVVAPAAELKVFLTADPHERARRRADELGIEHAQVLAEQTIRDQRDSTRERESRCARPRTRWSLDTTGLTVEQVVDADAPVGQYCGPSRLAAQS